MLMRKFEFVDDRGQFSIVEMPENTDPKIFVRDNSPSVGSRFCRTWVGEQGAYRVCRLRVSDSPFVNTLCVKGGYIKIKNKDYVTV